MEFSEGIILPLWKFVGKQKHGIVSRGFSAFSEDYSVVFTDCDLELNDLPWRLDYDAGRDQEVTLGEFSIKQYTRYTNHIVALIDKWAVGERIKKDDVTIADFLPGFTQAQTAEFIKAAGENNCSNVMAILLDYKEKAFGGYDPMEEFVLDI